MTTRELGVALALAGALAGAAGCSHKAAPTEAAPQAAPATAVTARPPGGQLTQTSGTRIALADVLRQHAQTVVVFYRGFY